MENLVHEPALSALKALDAYMREAGYSGPDPYDGLNSSFSRLARTKVLRQALIQVNKRSPIELRALLGIKPVQMGKTLGLVLSSFGAVPACFPDVHERSRQLRSLLLGKRNPDGAWGYEFDVQMRWGQYPAGTSNVIATSFAVDGLLATFPSAGEPADWRTETANWIEGSLSRDGYITYAPTSDRLIHNASLLGAVTLFQCVGEHPLIATAIERTLAAQSTDGSFPYGDEPQTAWVDSFHTAYVLLALQKLRPHYSEVEDSITRGLEYWLQACFDSDSRVKYFANDASATADAHTNATTLITLCSFIEDAAAREKLDSFAGHYFSAVGEQGFFSNRRYGKPYMRWELAHQLRGIAEYLRVVEPEFSSGLTIGNVE